MNSTVDFASSVLAVMVPLIALLGALRKTSDWPRWQSIVVSVSVPAIAVCILLLTVSIVFSDKSDDQAIRVVLTDESRGQVELPNPTREVKAPPKKAQPETKIEVETRTFAFSRRNSHCSGSHRVKWPVKATPGWEIDIHSIQDKVTVKSSRSNYDGIVEKTKDGFFVTGRVINSGNCVKVLGQVVAKDGRGSLHVKGSYKETRKVPATS